ncbi:hypothetical protein BDY17DRAFT_305017 [Neohortaea acidophila]|uniref:CUE domain-containing protein n=1 Tax=Neohortaea acidophila TaxID=245834 RepID=A0A6A6PGL4_9PEZI|nr:uncharacterized protein BDY17DRAFT_305017 [Neohortaea acidophila]KAF2479120.1 hypothetical protein BDY17DRAFT_305017 [Neohortaea acidophila]
MADRGFYDNDEAQNRPLQQPMEPFNASAAVAGEQNPWSSTAQQPQDHQHQAQQQYQSSNNPFEAVEEQNPWSSHPQAQQQSQYQPYEQQQQQSQHFDPPPGLPQDARGQAPSLPQRRPSFEEAAFVPEEERGEQREAMEQFELNKSGNESQQDRDVARLQQEFPGLDGSLIAALYSDNGNLGATREMLNELAGGAQ